MVKMVKMVKIVKIVKKNDIVYSRYFHNQYGIYLHSKA